MHEPVLKRLQSLDPAVVEPVGDAAQSPPASPAFRLLHLLRRLHRRTAASAAISSAPVSHQLFISSSVISTWHCMPRLLPIDETLVLAVAVAHDADRALRNREGFAMPVKGFEALDAGSEPLLWRLDCRLSISPQPISLTGLRPTLPPNALDINCPPRQCPRTGTSRAIPCRISSQHRRNPGQIIVDAHRPAHEHQTAECCGSAGTASPWSTAISCQGMSARIQIRGKITRPFRGRMAKYRNRLHR